MAAQFNLLPDGRVHFNHGPIDIIAQVDAPFSGPRNRAMSLLWTRFRNVLAELCSELPFLRSSDRENWTCLKGPIARRMAAAVSPIDTIITPMAAVAGAVADELLHVACVEERLNRVIINNGGDTSIYLGIAEECQIGLVSDLDTGHLNGKLRITADDNVRGVATSGWRGRSHSLGIADSVTVTAADCAVADAAATIIANAIDLPGHPGVHRVPANQLAPDSDLGERLVTTDVVSLSTAEAESALHCGWLVANELRARGLIQSTAMFLCGAFMAVDGLEHRITSQRNDIR